MPDDRCKDCIKEAIPVAPKPLDQSLLQAAQHAGTLDGLLDIWVMQPAERQDALLDIAVMLLRWASEERRAGRVILSGNPETGELRRLDWSSLEQVMRQERRDGIAQPQAMRTQTNSG